MERENETTRQPVGPGLDASPDSSFDPAVIDFGHYCGRTVAELAQTDPDYLRWLERHPSGARYRTEIRRVLGGVAPVSGWQP